MTDDDLCWSRSACSTLSTSFHFNYFASCLYRYIVSACLTRQNVITKWKKHDLFICLMVYTMPSNLACLILIVFHWGNQHITESVVKLAPAYIINLVVFVSLDGRWQQKVISRKTLKYNRKSVWSLGAKAIRMTASVRKNV